MKNMNDRKELWNMGKIDWKRKLSSRKLWAAAAGIVTGLAMVFGLDEGTISSVAGAVVSLASVVTYIMTEGRVDAESAKKAVDVFGSHSPCQKSDDSASSQAEGDYEQT